MSMGQRVAAMIMNGLGLDDRNDWEKCIPKPNVTLTFVEKGSYRYAKHTTIQIKKKKLFFQISNFVSIKWANQRKTS
jgi:hypothetical protein